MNQGPKRRWHWGLVSVPMALLAWLYFTQGVPSFVFPGPMAVLQTAIQNVVSPSFYVNLEASLIRLALGFSIGSIVGMALGMAQGRFHWADEAMSPFVSFFQSVPPITWVPLFIILMGIGDLPIVSVVSLATMFPVAIAVNQAMRAIPPNQVLAARALGARNLSMLIAFYLPATVPSLAGGLRVGFGIAWRTLVASEMVGGNNGIGFAIQTAGQVGNSGEVIWGIFVIGGLSLVFDSLFLRRLERWRSGPAREPQRRLRRGLKGQAP